jgi:hypothetical protein
MVLNSSLNSNQAATIGINRITFVPHLFYVPYLLVARNTQQEVKSSDT